MALRYDEIRAFTGAEVGQMESELSRIRSVIAQKESDLSSVKWNPLNYIVEFQRDAMTRMENGLMQDRHVLAQLESSRDDTIESGDTDKLARWFDLSATIGDAADLRIWNDQKKYASTTETAKNVGAETIKDIKNPFGVPWWVWAGGIAGLLLLGRRK